MGIPIHKYHPKIADRVLEMLDQAKRPQSVKEVYEHLFMAQHPSEPPIKERTVAATLRTMAIKKEIFSVGSFRDRVYMSCEQGEAWKEDRGPLLSSQKPEKKEMTTRELIDTFKAIIPAVLEMLEHYNEMKEAMKFYVEEAKNLGVRPGVVRVK